MTDLMFDIYLRDAPGEAWQALTDPAIVPRWRFGMSFETDWQPGSPLTSQSPDGEGTVAESVPGQRLVYSWSQAGAGPEANGGHPSTVAFELTPMGEVTRLTTVHGDLAPDGSFVTIVAPGWPMASSPIIII